MKIFNLMKLKMADYRSLFTLICLIFGKPCFTIKQNFRKMHSEKCKLGRIQNGTLSVVIYFNMPDIW